MVAALKVKLWRDARVGETRMGGMVEGRRKRRVNIKCNTCWSSFVA